MYASACLSKGVFIWDDRSFTRQDEIDLNADIRNIEIDLVILAKSQGWIDDSGHVRVSNDYNDDGSNIVVTDLTSLFIPDEDGIYSLNEEIIKLRFSDTGFRNPRRFMLETERQLRVRYGDGILERYISRLIYAYFPGIDIELNAINSENTSQFYEILNGYWVLYAMQNALLSYTNDRQGLSKSS